MIKKIHDIKQLRRAFGSYMTGVTVVTATDSNKAPVGFTANSFTSVSLDPPLLLVCPGKHINSYEIFNTCTHFAVSVLAEEQEAISNNFASGPDDRFARVDWHMDSYGSPLIKNVCANFSCKVHQRHEVGDHMILIGEVLDFTSDKTKGLGFCSNGYFSLSKERQADSSSQLNSVGVSGVIVKCGDQVLVSRQNHQLTLPAVEQEGHLGPLSAMQHYLRGVEPSISLGSVYSIYDDSRNKKRFTYFLASTDKIQPSELGEFIPIATLDPQQFSDQAQATMMQRFCAEATKNVFGLYLGDITAGEVHHSRNSPE